jgi:hypothetical protein
MTRFWNCGKFCLFFRKTAQLLINLSEVFSKIIFNNTFIIRLKIAVNITQADAAEQKYYN